MKVFINILVAFILSISTAAMAAPATEQSIKQLLAVTEAHKFADDVIAQYKFFINNITQKALKGKSPNQKQKIVIANMNEKIMAIVHNEMAWNKLEPLYIRLYKETFTEEEVVGMLSFYETPAGKALLSKMPALLQNAMTECRNMMSASLPRIAKIEEEFVKTMEDAGGN